MNGYSNGKAEKLDVMSDKLNYIMPIGFDVQIFLSPVLLGQVIKNEIN